MGSYIISTTRELNVAAGANIRARDMVWINADGFAEPAPPPGSGITGIVVGSATADVDNTDGDDGDLTVIVERSQGKRAFTFAAGDLTAADVGKTVYVGATPKTVSTTSTNAVEAGRLDGLEDNSRCAVIFNL